ncbi:dienelactone hydrolase [Biscogniauxia sp. FL1348]|nr:dienelactone hydrolase [Biscogniauxia sp. FL1348]
MLINESHTDVQTTVDGKESPMRIFLFHPTIPQYPKARFPGVVLFSEIYQVSGPVSRFARQISGHGYIVAAVSSYHDFVGPEALPYDVPGTDKGNELKITKLDPRISACVSYFATDVHCRTLGPTSGPNMSAQSEAGSNHTLDRLSEIKGEVAMIFGIKDTHVPDAGRDLVRQKLREAGVAFNFHEFAWAQHAFIRDELSKGRYDPAITKICFEVLLELFGRTLKTDLGERDSRPQEVEHFC